MIYTPEEEARLERRSQYLVRRLVWFWPIVTNVDDVERVTLFGYWVCVSLGLINLVEFAVMLLKRASPGDVAWGACFASVSFGFYFLGGNAVRVRSFPAAVLLAVVTCSLTLFGYVLHGHLDRQTPIESVLFLIMLRGIYLASRYRPKEGEGPPIGLVAFFGHGLVDRLPQRIWPKFQILFWVFGAMMLIFWLTTSLIVSGKLDPVIQHLQR
jgi:hypothetical protein